MQCSILAAMSVDGFIARSLDDRSFDWTSPADKQFYIESIKRAGVVVMGSQTFKTFSKYPKGLTYVIYTRQPATFQNPKPDIITTIPTQANPSEILKQLEQKGYSEVAICGGSSIYTMFLKSGLVTKAYLTIEPHLFGDGVKLLKESLGVKLTLVNTTHLSDQTLLLEYDVQA